MNNLCFFVNYLMVNVMKKNFFYLLLVFVTVLVSACSGKSGNQTGGGKSILMPPASGRPYELLVVINQDMWERPAGRALYNVHNRTHDYGRLFANVQII